MTEGENFYSERVSGIIRDIEIRRKKWMKIYTLVEKYIKRTQNAEIRTLLENYHDKSERAFIQKYAETKIAVKSFELTRLSYIFAGIAISLAVLIPILSPPPNLILVYIIFFYLSVGLLVWFTFFSKEILEGIIIAIEADKLTTQKTDDSEQIIDAKTNGTGVVIVKPKFWDWFLGLGWLSISTSRDSDWRRKAKDFYRDDFFGSSPVYTPLSWTKEILLESYKVIMDTYKQFVVVLATALFSGAVWSGIIVRATGSSVDYGVLEIFWLPIILVFMVLYIRMRFRVAVREMMLTVVLEHKCDEQCRNRHFP